MSAIKFNLFLFSTLLIFHLINSDCPKSGGTCTPNKGCCRGYDCKNGKCCVNVNGYCSGENDTCCDKTKKCTRVAHASFQCMKGGGL
uniref:Candidate secreted effector n=1 Tax=Meloidogyne incognita TaxID=6306 RepID=A0A914NKK8_MELIC